MTGAPGEPGPSPLMWETHSRSWLVEEAVRRWALRSRAIIGNLNDEPRAMERFLRSGAEWPWNGGKTHIEMIREEFQQLSRLPDDRWRVVRVRAMGG